MTRRLLNSLTVLSLLLCVAVAGLWVRTELLGRTDVVAWGAAGVFRCVEFSADDVDIRVLSDPGLGPTPLRWDRQRGGWARPPAPPNPAAARVSWIMPSPASVVAGRFVVIPSPLTPGSRPVHVTASNGGLPAAGFEYATFPGWYGPGTSLRSYRVSYFLVLVPAAVPPLAWLARFAVRRRRFGRYGPGRCRRCGYDLRATPGRCPECGTAVVAA